MSKNLEELKEFKKDNKLEPRQKIIYHIVCVLEDFEKRLAELEKFKGDTLGYYEINETGGANNIKIGGTDPD
ncbi:hypothetical protein ES705_26107 [subsurface metagenome]